MTKFNYLSDICGSDKAFCARIRLIENVDVEKGDIVYFDETALGVTTKKSDSVVKAGVCAETYKAEASDLVPANGSGMINVIVSADALYRVAPVILAAEFVVNGNGIKTKLTSSDLSDITGVVGSKLVLVDKASDSQCGASVGSVHTITSVELASGNVVFKTNTGIKGYDGDKYAFVPPYGFELLDIDSKGELVLQFEKKGSFTVMDASDKAYVLKICDIK